MDFRECLLAWLKHLGLSQRKLAIRLGVTPGAVSMWVNDGEYATTPSAKNQAAVVEALGLTMASFWAGPAKKAKKARASA